jgi:hypothetical protein
MKSPLYSGINIQWPISQKILDGLKTVETRTYPLPAKHVGKEIILIDTPGPTGQFKSRSVAILVFSGCFLYENERHFRRDFERHQVEPCSAWDWKNDKDKWGWVIQSVRPIKSNFKIPAKRGIVFCSNIKV